MITSIDVVGFFQIWRVSQVIIDFKQQIFSHIHTSSNLISCAHAVSMRNTAPYLVVMFAESFQGDQGFPEEIFLSKGIQAYLIH